MKKWPWPQLLPHQERALVLPFPLRSDFLAQITVPIDMTKEEADRLCAFVQSLAQAKEQPK